MADGRLRIRGARAALPGGCSDGPFSVGIAAGRIAALGEEADRAGGEVVEADGLFLLPGFIDLQVNDIAWLARGLQDPEAHAARIREVAAYQADRGVTGFVLATLAAPLGEILAYLVGMDHVLGKPRAPADHAFLGGLVEGSFMNPAFHGAHNPDWIVPADRALLDRFVQTRALRLLNVAPECSEEAIEVIREATQRGIVVGCGHAKPHAERVRDAVEAGLRYVIHLGNGPTGSSLKRFHDGGLLEEALRNDRLMVTVIIDGQHVHPRLVRDWIARKEVHRIIGVSDAGFALGPPQGDFEVFGVRGRVAADRSYLYVVAAGSSSPEEPDNSEKSRSSDAVALFGSAVDQRDVFENTLNLLSRETEGVYHRRHEAWELERALSAAASICSENAARLLGIDDRGRIETGCRADLVLARITGGPGNYRVGIDRTFIGGEEP